MSTNSFGNSMMGLNLNNSPLPEPQPPSPSKSVDEQPLQYNTTGNGRRRSSLTTQFPPVSNNLIEPSEAAKSASTYRP